MAMTTVVCWRDLSTGACVVLMTGRAMVAEYFPQSTAKLREVSGSRVHSGVLNPGASAPIDALLNSDRQLRRDILRARTAGWLADLAERGLPPATPKTPDRPPR